MVGLLPRALWGSEGGGRFLMSEAPLYTYVPRLIGSVQRLVATICMGCEGGAV